MEFLGRLAMEQMQLVLDLPWLLVAAGWSSWLYVDHSGGCVELPSGGDWRTAQDRVDEPAYVVDFEAAADDRSLWVPNLAEEVAAVRRSVSRCG